MNIDMIKTLYDYHFGINRRLWDESVMALTDAQFTEETDYSAGSVRGQILHMMTWDEQWFARLNEVEPPPRLTDDLFADRAAIRAYWDQIESTMHKYLKELDEDTFTGTVQIISKTRGEANLPAWQILLHVANHATDHRAQTLRLLAQLGAPTFEQDFMIYLWAREH
jgi:uncharacterized damage-inducible protein DinB